MAACRVPSSLILDLSSWSSNLSGPDFILAKSYVTHWSAEATNWSRFIVSRKTLCLADSYKWALDVERCHLLWFGVGSRNVTNDVSLFRQLVTQLLMLANIIFCFSKAQALWFPAHQISWLSDWVVECAIFLHWLAQQWSPWKKTKFGTE